MITQGQMTKTPANFYCHALRRDRDTETQGQRDPENQRPRDPETHRHRDTQTHRDTHTETQRSQDPDK